MDNKKKYKSFMISPQFHKRIMQKKLDLESESVEALLEELLDFFEDEDGEPRWE